MRIPPFARAAAPAAAALASLAGLAAAQTSGVVDPTPDPPPTATWPVFADIGDQVGAPGTDFKDVGSGRGQALVDVVGPDPSDPGNPAKVGPPDGRLDLVQANSNSPGMPLGLPPGQWIVPEIGTQQHPSMLLRQESDGSWSDVAPALSAGSPEGFNILYPGGSPWGVSAADHDGDGDSDLFYACGGFNCSSPNALFRNGGDGTLVNVTAAAGIQGTQASFASAWLDADLDGDLDLYVANAGILLATYYVGLVPDPTDRLYRNEGDGTFTEVAAQAGTDLRSSSFSVATGDLDLDGDTDLVVSCFKMWNKAFYGNGDGTFSFMAPATNPAWSFSLADLAPMTSVAANPPAMDFPSVAPATSATLPMELFWSMPVEIADFNGDRWPDVAIVGWASQLVDDDPTSALGALFTHAERGRLYLNRGDQDSDGVGDGEFREVGEETGFTHIGGAMGMVAGDYNGDGFIDVYIGGGGPNLATQLEEDYLYINEPTAWPADFQQDPDQPLVKAFYEIGALAGVYGNTYMCHGLTAFRRGERLDVLVGNGGPAIFDAGQSNVYYANTGNADGLPYELVDVALVPTASVPGAIGSRVELIRDTHGGAGQVLVREQSGGARFGSHNTGPMTFGLGRDGLLFANVTWQSGARQGELLWPAPAPDVLTFVEPELSLGLDASYPAGGGVDLELTLTTTSATGHLGQLFLAVLLPNAGGPGFQLWNALPVLAPLAVTPSTPFQAGTHVATPLEALYALAYVDLVTGEVLNAGAIWHEPALETPSAPLTYDPPAGPDAGAAVAGGAGAGGGRPAPRGRELLGVRERVRLAADAVEVAPARAPVVYETIDTRGTGEVRLPGGDRLRWAGGEVEVVLEGVALGTLAFERDGAVLSVGLPTVCCEVLPPTAGSLVRFPGAQRLTVDGEPWTAAGLPAASAR